MSSRTGARSFWPVLVICAAAVGAYWNSLDGPFVFDDESSIVTNSTIRELWAWPGALATPQENVTAQGRPVLNLSLAINYALHGTAVRGYHVGNVIIHALAGLALWGVVRRTLVQCREGADGGGEGVALAVAVLWTVHPLQTESVTYIIQRAESLVGLFYLVTIYCFARGAAEERAGGRGWLVGSVAACALGMTTKEVMVTAPLMVLFYDRVFVAGTFVGALRQRAGYYAALAGTWVLLAWLVAQTGGNRGGSVGFGVGVSAIDYWLTQFKAVAHYLWLAVWPHPLVFEYGTFWIREFAEIAVPGAVVLGLLAATVVALGRRKPAGFLGAWFFGILAPTSLAPGTTQMIVEHRMYLPLAAVIAVLVLAVRKAVGGRGSAVGRRWVAAVGTVTLAGVLLTAERNRDYRSEMALWTDTLAKRPKNALAHFMLAGAQERAGRVAEAIASYERGLELKPDFSIGHESLGRLLLRERRVAEAVGHLESAVRIQPEFGDAHANLGNAYLAMGRVAEAVAHLERAVALLPKSAVTRYNLANALAAAGLRAEAIAGYEAALRLDPDMPEARFNLANALVAEQRVEDAVAQYRAAVKLRPDYAGAHYNLANVLAGMGRQAEAVEHYEAALRARPDYAEAHHNLGSAMFELRRFEEAARHYEEALRLAPDFPNARGNLERVREKMRTANGRE